MKHCYTFPYVGDLFVDGNFMSLDSIQNILGKSGKVFFQYYALVNALRNEWRNHDLNDWNMNQEPTFCDEKISNLTAKSIRHNLVNVFHSGIGNLMMLK